MSDSIFDAAVEQAFRDAATARRKSVRLDHQEVEITTPFPSPPDWRSQWIYFLLLDRFNNPQSPPRHLPFDGEHESFQGGTLNGVREQLNYLRELGAGALWLSPVLTNCQYEDTTYHGYGFQDFLAIEPRFSSDVERAKRDPAFVEAELRALVDEAHARGIYVIFDVVLNHAGNVFAYDDFGDTAPFRSTPYAVQWRDENGNPTFPDLSSTGGLARDAAVWPRELHDNDFFRRQGKGGEAGGDFESLKELVTGFVDSTDFGPLFPVRSTLIRAYQYLIAKFDVDGFRIDTLKFIAPEFARIFGNAMREYASSIGKSNFFTFGEVFDDEKKVAHFVGRNASDVDQPIGVDAALDFPLFFRLPSVLKGFAAPTELERLYSRRKDVQRGLMTSHGEAAGHFVTFLDNHDMRERFYFRDPVDPDRFDDQVTMALACLFALQGIPCLYYGTEQGLHGRGGRDLAVREALWGKPDAFDRAHAFYDIVRRLSDIRTANPALRFGRQYFRPLSGNGVQFGISPFPGGVLSFARILNESEMLAVANSSATDSFQGEVIVDAALNPEGTPYETVFSTKSHPTSPSLVMTKARGTIEIEESGRGFSVGPAKVVGVRLEPLEVQYLRRASST